MQEIVQSDDQDREADTEDAQDVRPKECPVRQVVFHLTRRGYQKPPAFSDRDE